MQAQKLFELRNSNKQQFVCTTSVGEDNNQDETIGQQQAPVVNLNATTTLASDVSIKDLSAAQVAGANIDCAKGSPTRDNKRQFKATEQQLNDDEEVAKEEAIIVKTKLPRPRKAGSVRLTRVCLRIATTLSPLKS